MLRRRIGDVANSIGRSIALHCSAETPATAYVGGGRSMVRRADGRGDSIVQKTREVSMSDERDDPVLHGDGSVVRLTPQSMTDAANLARACGLVVLLPLDEAKLPPDAERVFEALVDSDVRHRRYMATYGNAGGFFFRLVGMPPSESPGISGRRFREGRWPMVIDESEGVIRGLITHPEVTVQVDAMSVGGVDFAGLLASIDVAATPA